MNKRFVNKLLVAGICIFCLLLIVFPYSFSFSAGEEGIKDERWEPIFVMKSFELAIIFSPFYVLWLVYLFISHDQVKKIIRYTLLALSFLYFVLAAENVVFISPDFEPGIGVLLSAGLFPLVLAHNACVFDKRKKD